MPTVLVLGTLDTKGDECAYLRERIRRLGCEVLLVDVGVLGRALMFADVTREEVASAGGFSIMALTAGGDRGVAVEAMGEGAAVIVRGLYERGQLDAFLAVGGSGGATIAARAMRELPVGVPKILVSTVAAGDTRPYVGESDVALMYSVVDLAGLNRISERVLANAAAAVAGMALALPVDNDDPARPLFGATMFGITTVAVTRARELLESCGYEVLVFSANGVGGRTLERLVESGLVAGVLDVTTTELADELVGGILSAGEDRLEAAGKAGIPQVVSLGALDVVNFGPRITVPESFATRRLYAHNPTVTLMRTSPAECEELGRILARKLNAALGPCTVFVPLRGFSALSTEGGEFADRDADEALINSLRSSLDDSVELVEMDCDVNDGTFAAAMARRLHEHYQAWITA